MREKLSEGVYQSSGLPGIVEIVASKHQAFVKMREDASKHQAHEYMCLVKNIYRSSGSQGVAFAHQAA